MSSTAVSWQNRLISSAEDAHRRSEEGTQSGGLSLSSLTVILDGGNSALSASTMANATGIIEYCAKNRLSSFTASGEVQRQLIYKLNLHHPANSAAKHDYALGQQGQLNTRNGQQLDMNDLSHSELALEVKTKACDFVLRQGMDFLTP